MIINIWVLYCYITFLFEFPCIPGALLYCSLPAPHFLRARSETRILSTSHGSAVEMASSGHLAINAKWAAITRSQPREDRPVWVTTRVDLEGFYGNLRKSEVEKKTMPHFLWPEPLSPAQLKRLEEHKYSASGRSLFEPPCQIYWNWLVQQIPTWVAPNTLTIVGLLVNIFSTVVLVYYCPTATEEVSRATSAGVSTPRPSRIMLFLRERMRIPNSNKGWFKVKWPPVFGLSIKSHDLGYIQNHHSILLNSAYS